MTAFSHTIALGEVGRGNEVLTAIGTVTRDLTFLEITRREHEDAHGVYITHTNSRVARMRAQPAGRRRLTDEEVAEFDHGAHLADVLHLRIETFYLYAQRLLDDLVAMADAIRGPSGVTLGRHRGLKRNLDSAVAAGELPASGDEFLTLIGEVTSEIKSYRDRYVAHSGNRPLMKATIFDTLAKTAQISVAGMPPREGEFDVRSGSVEELAGLLARYVISWIEYLEAVRAAAPR